MMMKRLRTLFVISSPALFIVVLLLSVSSLLVSSAQQKQPLALPDAPAPGLAQTPPMGFDQYNAFHDHITAAQLKAMADALVSSGMRDAGYTYLNIDDSWAGYTRSLDASIAIDTAQFPPVNGVNGIQDLANYVHARGLKLGIYTTDGPHTCIGRRLGSLGHEAVDMEAYAAWGVDFLKIDNCSTWHNDQDVINTARTFHDLSIIYGRPMVISMHAPDWFQPDDVPTLFRYAQMSREFGDIQDTFASVLSHAQAQVALTTFAGPGHWNDPDMLEVGNGGMTTLEDQTHFSLWCILAAPLLAGNDLLTMSDATRNILINREAIAIDQDPAGISGRPISVQGSQEVWARPLANGDYAVLLLNAGAAPAAIQTTAQQLGLPAAATYRIRNVWTHTTTTANGLISAVLPPRGSILLRVSVPKSAAIPTSPSLSMLPLLACFLFLKGRRED